MFIEINTYICAYVHIYLSLDCNCNYESFTLLLHVQIIFLRLRLGTHRICAAGTLHNLKKLCRSALNRGLQSVCIV